MKAGKLNSIDMMGESEDEVITITLTDVVESVYFVGPRIQCGSIPIRVLDEARRRWRDRSEYVIINSDEIEWSRMPVVDVLISCHTEYARDCKIYSAKQ